jgi:hypothetical protein
MERGKQKRLTTFQERKKREEFSSGRDLPLGNQLEAMGRGLFPPGYKIDHVCDDDPLQPGFGEDLGGITEVAVHADDRLNSQIVHEILQVIGGVNGSYGNRYSVQPMQGKIGDDGLGEVVHIENHPISLGYRVCVQGGGELQNHFVEFFVTVSFTQANDSRFIRDFSSLFRETSVDGIFQLFQFHS